MTRNQILVISGTLLIGAAVFLLPREGFRKEESKSPNLEVTANEQFQTQLEAVKKAVMQKHLFE